jgi:hypothetical protein
MKAWAKASERVLVSGSVVLGWRTQGAGLVGRVCLMAIVGTLGVGSIGAARIARGARRVAKMVETCMFWDCLGYG